MIYQAIIQLLVGLLYANFFEVILHKFVLHGLGMKKGSFWRFHWSDHHMVCRRNHMVDESYKTPFWKSKARAKEIMGLFLLFAIHLPLIKIFPFFVVTVGLYKILYYFAHKHSHLKPDVAKKWLPWHYDHHMIKNQHKNWGVLLPIADWILGTRIKK